MIGSALTCERSHLLSMSSSTSPMTAMLSPRRMWRPRTTCKKFMYSGDSNTCYGYPGFLEWSREVLPGFTTHLSGDLKSRLIWNLNGQKEVWLQIVLILNGIWNPEAQPFEIMRRVPFLSKNIWNLEKKTFLPCLFWGEYESGWNLQQRWIWIQWGSE